MVKIKDKDEIAVPVPETPVDIQNDEYRGVGGSYVFDPATGKRTRVEPAQADTEIQTETEAVNNEGQ